MITTTLAELRKHGACFEGYNKVVRALQNNTFTEDDASRESYIRFAHKEEISLTSIVESNGIDDALWALRASDATDRDMRLYAIWCARKVEHLMMDLRSKDALNVAEKHANGFATDEELEAVRDAAWAAARAAAWAAARDAARAAASDAARDAARAAARAAAREAARDAARDAARAAASAAAREAASAAAREAASAAARDEQKAMFICMCNGTAPWQNV